MKDVIFSDIAESAGFQLSAVCISISCIYFTIVRSKNKSFRSKLFFMMLVNVLITALCNSVDTFVKPFLSESAFAVTVYRVSTYIYFPVHFVLAPLFCFYVSVLTGATRRLDKNKHILYEIPMYITVILSLTNPFTKWVYYFDENELFYRNTAEYIVYVICLIYYAVAVIFIMLYWDALSQKIKKVLTFFFIVVTIGTLLQLFFPPLHTELFSEALALTGIMITIENEEGRRDSRTGIYNHAALAYDIAQLSKAGQDFSIICIKMQNPMGYMRLIGQTNIEILTKNTYVFLEKLVVNADIYYIGTGTFVILDEQTEDGNKTQELAEKIKNRFNQGWDFKGYDMTFNALVYCAEYPKDLQSISNLMMLINSQGAPKGIRGDRVIKGEDLNFIIRQNQVEEAVVRGVREKKFEVYYQPIYDVSTMFITYGKTELRLHDPELGEVRPEEFMSVVDRAGGFWGLGDFILEEVCKFLRSGIPTEMGVEKMIVNLSAIQCAQPGYAKRIAEMFSKYEVSPEMLTIELADNIATINARAIKKFIEDLKEIGVTFSVYQGESKFFDAYMLGAFEFDAVRFGNNYVSESKNNAFEGIVELIRRMNMKTVLSGVNAKEDVDVAKDFGMDYLCGDFFSKATTQNEFISILRATRHARNEEQKAIAASEAMSNFLANMSHEIRTPINAVLGMDEVILRVSKDANVIEYAKNIESAGKTLLSLINDILDFSKIESGNIDIVEGAYQLSSTMQDVINMIELKARKKGLELVVNVEPTTPNGLYGDDMRVRQIMINLLNNAVKYTKEGKIVLGINYERTAKKEIMLKIMVKDTGIGIKEEDKGKLFSKFKRLDMNNNRTVEGTGLGLAITYQLLKHMKGDIKVDSEYGKGSTFIAYLPQQVIEDVDIGESWKKEIKKHTDKEKRQNGLIAKNARILVVDDTYMNLVVIRELLKKTGIDIDEVDSGAECLKKVTEVKYDVIFLDYRMPEMDGIETLDNMKKLDNNINKDTPVIALTANALSGAREKFLSAGFRDYLTKPVSGERLEETLMIYLSNDKIKS